ncbi:hypothetical protein FA15DRAFT_601974 [Coprinopsis marcescibilis]|uniref:DUF4218 domain-containing protein n=1 Tax=Coprinopsis marcescibilis TaxID=230819 RepID=A0A5C3KGH2_COPMA|nr:hypothetical protein FA15DRAFT_601974 [Coprinopsis marcescibilis]
MFLVGMIPGPNEPPLETINHYFTPLVNELLEFWKHGVYLSRTYRHPQGRRVRCALVAIVCDLPGSRKTAGFTAPSHTHFCSICECRNSFKNHKQQYEGYVDTPFCLWKRRSAELCRAAGEQFLAATNEKERKAAFDGTGVRWSEFHRLPYFDPSRFVVVDAMHNLFLGLTQVHCTTILGICVRDNKTAMPSKALHIPFRNDWELLSPTEQTAVKYLKSALEGPLNAQIAKDRDGVIKRFEPQEEREEVDHDNNTIGEQLAELRADISAMLVPSWMSKVPSNLGDPSHGKLKADHWRMLATVFLPASLIRLWAQTDGGDTDAESVRKRRLLEVTMSLFSAISIATGHSTSSAKAQLYLQHYQAYIDGVKELFPNYVFRPNHHMAFHLAEYLEMYGPVHSWWTFPFERMIGMLQRIPTNNKICE